MAKGRESGMPEEESWDAFFDPPCVLSALGCSDLTGDVIEFGCGYGTFTEAAARRTRGVVYAIDIEPDMIERTKRRMREAGLNNVVAQQRDFMAAGCGRPHESAEYVLLFNILHIERPVELLGEAFRVLKPGGMVGVIHWNYDPTTPRGPSMEIRPKPGQCAEWATSVGFAVERFEPLECAPYHYGLSLCRPQSKFRRQTDEKSFQRIVVP